MPLENQMRERTARLSSCHLLSLSGSFPLSPCSIGKRFPCSQAILSPLTGCIRGEQRCGERERIEDRERRESCSQIYSPATISGIVHTHTQRETCRHCIAGERAERGLYSFPMNCRSVQAGEHSGNDTNQILLMLPMEILQIVGLRHIFFSSLVVVIVSLRRPCHRKM